jgi:type III pantothenate kinase
MRLVLVDIGNSATKVCVADPSGNLSPFVSCRDFGKDFDFQSLPQSDCHWIISSVNAPQLTLVSEAISKTRPGDRQTVVAHQDIDLDISVDRPAAVGIDRLLVAFAVTSKLKHGETGIIVDAGTAVTIDLVSNDNQFLGGVIYPGVDAAFRQITNQTDALPSLDYQSRTKLLEPWQNSTPWQKDTAPAIIAGIYNLQLAGLAQIVSRYIEQATGKPRVFLTGGGVDELLQAATTFDYQLSWLVPKNVFPTLIFDGLKRIAAKSNA